MYGSGRFCSTKCARGFSTKYRRNEINEKIQATLTGSGHDDVKIKCLKCDNELYVKWNRRNQKFCNVSCSSSYHMADKSYFYSELAKKTGLGGNRNNYAHGWYDSPIAGRVYLESSYEYKVAVELDKNKIKWERPAPLNYDNKKYYPDFYLIDYGIYLDPKNDYLIEKDYTKINRVEKINDVIVLVLDKHNLTWERIRKNISFLRISGGAPVLYTG